MGKSHSAGSLLLRSQIGEGLSPFWHWALSVSFLGDEAET